MTYENIYNRFKHLFVGPTVHPRITVDNIELLARFGKSSDVEFVAQLLTLGFKPYPIGSEKDHGWTALLLIGKEEI